MTNSFDSITLEILWNRMTAIVDEAANALIRASFSTVVREAHDFATVVMDAQGNSLAQASLSIPVFIGTIPLTTKHLLSHFKTENL